VSGPPDPAPPPEPLLAVEGLVKHFGARAGFFSPAPPVVRAIDGVSLTVGRGEVVGLVGESGSGKTTVGRAVLRLVKPTAGRILFDGRDLADLDESALRPLRRRMQIIFQDPFASLNPRMRVDAILGEALTIHDLWGDGDRAARLAGLMERVGLAAHQLRRYPHEFSGGQRQRIAIARALAVEPDFIVADEPVSALDVSIQAQIVNLLARLQRDFGLAMLFISHDLSVVEHLCDRVIVMYLGRVMESGPTDEIFSHPRHPYTEALIAASPIPDPDAPRKRIVLAGDMPSPTNPPSGCVFRTRCRYALPACADAPPPALRKVGADHYRACIRDDIL
jgi:oligopeptide/dipeptide ABC transporter ATP-binding protein